MNYVVCYPSDSYSSAALKHPLAVGVSLTRVISLWKRIYRRLASHVSCARYIVS